MITQTQSVILLDVESSDHGSIIEALAERGFRCEVVASLDGAARRLGDFEFDAAVVYERAAGERLDNFVSSIRAAHPRLAIIAVQTEYDGQHECRLFDLGVDDVVTCEYPASLLAVRTSLRAKNRHEMIFPRASE